MSAMIPKCTWDRMGAEMAARHATRIVALKNGTIAGEGPLNPALIRTIFDVESRVRGEAPFVTVDILSP